MGLSIPALRAALCICLIICTIGGCATYETQKISSAPGSSTLSKESSASMGAVSFRCVSLADKDASRNYLGVDPSSTGMVPVFVKVQNNGDHPIKVDCAKCFLTASAGGETFRALTVNEACERARRSDAHVIAATFAFGMMGAIISGTHVAEVNRTLEQDYYDKSFKPTLLNSGAEGQGVIFFDALGEKQALLRSLVVTTIDVDTMEPRETQLDLPR
jgi:hypothetical protein